MLPTAAPQLGRGGTVVARGPPLGSGQLRWTVSRDRATLSSPVGATSERFVGQTGRSPSRLGSTTAF